MNQIESSRCPRVTIVAVVFFMATFAVAQRFSPSAMADVVWVKDQSQPLYGTVIERTPQELRLHEFGSPENSLRIIPNETIELLVVNVDIPRLEKLDPQKPQAYRDYAEELSTQKQDPVARELAVRLYLIGAYLAEGEPGDAELRQSCLNGLVALAETQRQYDSWNTLRFLYSPGQRLDEGPDREAETAPPNEQQRQRALEVVRLIRRGNGSEAASRIEQPEFQAALGPWSGFCPLDQLQRMSTSSRLTLSQLHQLIQMELAILNGEFSKTGRAGDRRRRHWSDSASKTSTIGGSIASFKTAVPFDPGQSVFRNGTWVRPE